MAFKKTEPHRRLQRNTKQLGPIFLSPAHKSSVNSIASGKTLTGVEKGQPRTRACLEKYPVLRYLCDERDTQGNHRALP